MNEITKPLECIVRETGDNPDACVIWLHGLGADGHDFEPIVPQLGLTSRHRVRFMFPHAPVRPVTINGGMAMRAWYDILELSIERKADRAGIDTSVTEVNRLIDHQIAAGIAPERIVLAGFSQGGAIALRCGLARTHALAGILALSCYLLDARELDQWLTPAGRGQKVWMGHGDIDPVVPVMLGQAAARQLSAAGVGVSWHTWPMPHAVCGEEIAAIDQWLDTRLT